MKTFDLQAESALSSCRKKAFAFVTLSIIILTVYSNTFHASWHLDDGPNIVENAALHMTDLTWSQVRKAAFTSPKVMLDVVTVRPVSRLTLALNYYLGKENVVGYHALNITVHLIASTFLFLLIYHTLSLPHLKARYGPNAYFISLLSTFMWAVNPIHTQAVTYIVQRMTSMAGMFYIMAMYYYLRARTAKDFSAKAVFIPLCLLSGLLSLGSKENALMLPLSLLLFDQLVLRTPTGENLRKGFRVFLLGFLLPATAVFLFLSLYTDFISSLFRLYEVRPFTLWERLLTQPRVLLFYLSLIFSFAPGRLSIDHGLPLSTSLFSPFTTLPAVILLIGMIGGSLYLARRRPLIAFAFLFFFVNHLMESTVLPLELVFEHRNYLPSMFLFLPVAILLSGSLSFFSRKPPMQWIVSLFIVLIIVGEGHGTFARNLAWKTEQTLWADCLSKYPDSFRAHHSLGLHYDRSGEKRKAISEYLRALTCPNRSSNKEKAITHFNLGVLAHGNRAFETARDHYGKALHLDPCLPGARNNLAALMQAQGGDPTAIQDELEKAIRCGHRKETAMAYSNLGILLLKTQRTDKGIEALQASLALDPENVATLKRLGYAYATKRLWGTAWLHYRKALRHIPQDLHLRLHLAEVYLLSGNPDRAARWISETVRTVPPKAFEIFFGHAKKRPGLFETEPDMALLLPSLAESLEKTAGRWNKGMEAWR